MAATSTEWQQPMSADVSKLIVAGKNTVTAKVANQGGVAAFVMKLAIKDATGKMAYVVSDTSWVGKSKDGGIKLIEVRGNYGDGPWGDPFAAAGRSSGIPRGTFQVLPGFKVDKLFTCLLYTSPSPRDQRGSRMPSSA